MMNKICCEHNKSSQCKDIALTCTCGQSKLKKTTMKWGKRKENDENKTDAVSEKKDISTMQCPSRSGIKMELKWSLVSIAIVRNMESTSNIIDFTGKSTQSACFPIVFAIKYLCAEVVKKCGTPTLIQTPTLCFLLSCPFSKVHPCYFFGLSRCLGYQTTLSTHPWGLENM